MNLLKKVKAQMLRNADIHGEEAVMYFIDGLPHEVQRNINMWKPETFDEALILARRATAIPSTAPTAQSAQHPIAAFDNRENRHVQFRTNSPHPAGRAYCEPCPCTRHSSRDSTDGQRRRSLSHDGT